MVSAGLYHPSKGPNPFPVEHLAAAAKAMPNQNKSRVSLWIGIGFLVALVAAILLMVFHFMPSLDPTHSFRSEVNQISSLVHSISVLA
jgi:hypothetical protein